MARLACDFSDGGSECQDSSDTTCVTLCSTKPMNVSCKEGQGLAR